MKAMFSWIRRSFDIKSWIVNIVGCLVLWAGEWVNTTISYNFIFDSSRAIGYSRASRFETYEISRFLCSFKISGLLYLHNLDSPVVTVKWVFHAVRVDGEFIKWHNWPSWLQGHECRWKPKGLETICGGAAFTESVYVKSTLSEPHHVATCKSTYFCLYSKVHKSAQKTLAIWPKKLYHEWMK